MHGHRAANSERVVSPRARSRLDILVRAWLLNLNKYIYTCGFLTNIVDLRIPHTATPTLLYRPGCGHAKPGGVEEAPNIYKPSAAPMDGQVRWQAGYVVTRRYAPYDTSHTNMLHPERTLRQLNWLDVMDRVTEAGLQIDTTCNRQIIILGCNTSNTNRGGIRTGPLAGRGCMTQWIGREPRPSTVCT